VIIFWNIVNLLSLFAVFNELLTNKKKSRARRFLGCVAMLVMVVSFAVLSRLK